VTWIRPVFFRLLLWHVKCTEKHYSFRKEIIRQLRFLWSSLGVFLSVIGPVWHSGATCWNQYPTQRVPVVSGQNENFCFHPMPSVCSTPRSYQIDVLRQALHQINSRRRQSPCSISFAPTDTANTSTLQREYSYHSFYFLFLSKQGRQSARTIQLFKVSMYMIKTRLIKVSLLVSVFFPNKSGWFLHNAPIWNSGKDQRSICLLIEHPIAAGKKPSQDSGPQHEHRASQTVEPI